MPIIGHEQGCAGLPLLTDRLALRELSYADIPAIVRFAGDRDVAEMTARIPHPYTEEDAEAFLRLAAEAKIDGGEIVRAITIRNRDGMVGAISVRLDRAANTGTLGYWLAKPEWGRGYVTEAAERIVRYGFEELGLKSVRASARPDNLASLRVLDKLGMSPAGTSLEDSPARGGPFPVELRSVGRADWFAKHALPITLVTAVALVDPDDRILLTRRPPGKPMAGLWEFPGGKVAPNETPEAALIRELREELDIDTATSCLAPLTFASHRYPDFHLLMPLFVCRVWSGTPQAKEGQDLAWVRPNNLRNYPMPPADMGIVALLRDLF